MRKTRCAFAVGLALAAGVAYAVVPQVSSDVKNATETIYKDPVMQKMLTELTSDENAQFRFNTHMKWPVLLHHRVLKCVVQKSWLAEWLKSGDLIKKTS